jgi:S-adenosylmethionine hydrolase
MPMIALFTDFGMSGPYVGQMKAVLHQQAPQALAIDLFADAPAHDPQLAAYLLAAYVDAFPPGTVFICVVDPGVGGPRRAAAVQADGRWYVGPDNGLFTLVARRAAISSWWDIRWAPPALSATFHGRDVFAPVAARLVRGEPCPGERVPAQSRVAAEWPDDLPKVVYIDHFGNAMTGLRASVVPKTRSLEVNGARIEFARTYADVPVGFPFWYENSNGLAEIAVNRGRAAERLGLQLGASVTVGP